MPIFLRKTNARNLGENFRKNAKTPNPYTWKVLSWGGFGVFSTMVPQGCGFSRKFSRGCGIHILPREWVRKRFERRIKVSWRPFLEIPITNSQRLWVAKHAEFEIEHVSPRRGFSTQNTRKYLRGTSEQGPFLLVRTDQTVLTEICVTGKIAWNCNWIYTLSFIVAWLGNI